MNNHTQVSEDESGCDFSSIMDTAFMAAPNFTGTEPPHNMYAGTVPPYEPGKSFLELELEKNPDLKFTPESIARGIGNMMRAQGIDPADLVTELEQRWAGAGAKRMDDYKPLPDPVGDLIRHFAIFYEHVYLLEGFPADAQPTVQELRLLGQRIHECLVNRDGSLNAANVARCEAAHMSVSLEGGFIQVVRGKAALRQKV